LKKKQMGKKEKKNNRIHWPLATESEKERSITHIVIPV
jgi:hypothetical protein